MKLDSEFPRLTYTHRTWRDADMYFFFNESNKEEQRTATLAGKGQAQVWDLTTGEIHPISGVTGAGGSVHVPLLLEPYEAKVIVIGPVPASAAGQQPALSSATRLLEVGGDWTVDLNGKQMTTPLKSWEDLGMQSFSGPATYRKQFTAPTMPAGKRVFLEIGDVRDYARIKLNGVELEGRDWQPYRWEITKSLKPGSNDLEIQVNASSSRGSNFGRAAPKPISGLLGPVVLLTR